jgi:hypothetical protein
MKFFYPDLNNITQYPEIEQEQYYCNLRDSYAKDPHNGSRRKNINMTKRIYSINVPVNGIFKKYTVGENCIAIFVTVDWIKTPIFFVFHVGEFLVPIEFLNDIRFNVEFFEGYH